jgi:hypothetical protein
MKNSTLFYLLSLLGAIIWLFFMVTKLMILLTLIMFGTYLITCLLDTIDKNNPVIKPKYNIFLFISKTLDSFPQIIKKNERSKD